MSFTKTISAFAALASIFGVSVATKEARDGVLNKLQKIMSEIEVEVSVDKVND